MLAEKTYKNLKTMIYRGELEPGEQLVERRLSRKLGVSRVPLRESLLRLESDGLIKRVPYGPSRVIDFSKSDVVEMYSIRLLLEPFATGLAALNHKPSLIRDLKEICQQMTLAGKARKWADLDQLDSEFHHSIVKTSGHRALYQAYEACHIQICGLLTKNIHAAATRPPDALARDHIPLIKAIEKGDLQEAELAAYWHVRRNVDFDQMPGGAPLTPKQRALVELPSWPGALAPRRNGKKY